MGWTTTSSEAFSYQGLTATIFPDSRQPSSKCSITWFLIQQPTFLVVCLPRKESSPLKFLSLWTDKPADETSSEDFSTQPASPTLRSGTATRRPGETFENAICTWSSIQTKIKRVLMRFHVKKYMISIFRVTWSTHEVKLSTMWNRWEAEKGRVRQKYIKKLK